MSSSVASSPGWSPASPETMTRGWSEPARTFPNASIARRSASIAVAKSPENHSW
ncbi:hypothetical protein ACFYO0_44545 [Streptomyces sp. NPDC006365]|uniref:hypothetical protein n=1 Tax=Streptomyces sp. NPDC006365 TaxID=3364744 RepID=UPI0036C125CC